MKELLNEKTQEELLKMLSSISEKLGQGSEFVFHAYYKQVYVHAFGNLLVAVLGASLLLVAIILTSKVRELANKMYDDGIWIFWGLTIIVGVFLLIMSLYQFVGKMVNPDYYVIQDLLTTLGQK